MQIPGEVVAAFLIMTGTIVAAIITAAGVIVARKIGGKVDDVYHEVTPNGGKSAHDVIIRKIDDVERRREQALADHELRLHPGAQQ